MAIQIDQQLQWAVIRFLLISCFYSVETNSICATAQGFVSFPRHVNNSKANGPRQLEPHQTLLRVRAGGQKLCNHLLRDMFCGVCLSVGKLRWILNCPNSRLHFGLKGSPFGHVSKCPTICKLVLKRTVLRGSIQIKWCVLYSLFPTMMEER